jgi:hypothetical protein
MNPSVAASERERIVRFTDQALSNTPRRQRRPMPADEILQEARKLHTVSERLSLLAERDPAVAEGLTMLARAVRNSATLLEVMVELKLTPEQDVEKTSN